MKLSPPVIWSKGTFLTPQHLQAQDRFIENQLRFQIDALTFNPWGFTTISIDQKALATGNFGVVSASGIFPDGLPFDIPESDVSPSAKPLAPYFDDKEGSRDVYLAIPQYLERGLNVTSPDHNTATRYTTDFHMFRDENNGTTEKPVQVARKRLRLLVEGDSREGNASMRIARVKKTPSGAFMLDASFVPPALNLHVSEHLISIARRLLEILSARTASLSGMRRQKNQSLADFTVQDVANFWLLYTINSQILPLRHLFESGRGHPERLFSVMLSLAGALTTFSQKIQPHDLPMYDHDNLSACFSELDEKTRLLLETVVPSNFVSLALKLVKPSIYAAAIDNDKYLAGARMYLAVNAQMGIADLINKAPQLIKICSADHVENLVSHALPGVKMTHIASPPNPVPVKLNYQYFSLNQAGAAWDAIARARNLAAYVSGDFPNPQLELIIVLPQSG
jgi:type VI secretion system protein ImpJ